MPARLTGIEETVRFFRAYGTQVPNFARFALKKAAEAIFEESQKLVPVRQKGEPPIDIDPGSLKASGKVVEGSKEENSVYYSVTYGAPYGAQRIAKYAIFVHEMPYRHIVGQWKYLTTAVDIVAPRIHDIIAFNFAQMQTDFFGTRGGGGRGRSPLANEGT